MSKTKQPIAIYYEHPHWFKPLFAELDRRKTPYVQVNAAQHHFDPAHLNGDGNYSLVFNRMSPRPTVADTARASSTPSTTSPILSRTASASSTARRPSALRPQRPSSFRCLNLSGCRIPSRA